MSTFNPDKEITHLICEQMGGDIDKQACEELQRYMEECPDCKVYFDSVTKVVKMYRKCDEEQDVPEDVTNRLFKVLNLKKKDE
ncbi:MAG: hypothetical protein HN729_09250 [Candidatus Marinimicrobia bacterium]|jgi:predicted anti-sigma-YlaC factor YlaD|nr:hypothetical protein [Candidatus Neomarinimicrobiota bacterium]MBT3633230.1 hypothetical protein [Candidatus Neomarinimicrobiota bacterium]MBT3682169.1 hypothetical protein [Candidatus Neomarinimicrobiota bacterium]MBT3758830.1 hypothetical protein [Candidatus Neomarinimicrobiota bacterium]MBT3895295.1 hypothetical protein [Candidatus Neomarinimicrobiota bacterium]